MLMFWTRRKQPDETLKISFRTQLISLNRKSIIDLGVIFPSSIILFDINNKNSILRIIIPSLSTPRQSIRKLNFRQEYFISNNHRHKEHVLHPIKIINITIKIIDFNGVVSLKNIAFWMVVFKWADWIVRITNRVQNTVITLIDHVVNMVVVGFKYVQVEVGGIIWNLWLLWSFPT